MAYEFKLTRRVEFGETDMAGIVHFSNFFRYMEAAECAFFRSLNFSLMARQLSPHVGWPRVHAECDYSQPLRFEDEFEMWIRIMDITTSTISYKCLLTSGEWKIASGGLTMTCVSKRPHEFMKPIPIPHDVAAHFEIWREED
jgi:YbgC/YbaW family acyl-CoA thioester hydrolase